MMLEAKSQYPLRDNAADDLLTHSGRPLSEITSEAIAAGELSGDDLRTHADTLRQQSAIARDGGFPQLAANLLRAAELTHVPNEELLRIYETLRPKRASYDEIASAGGLPGADLRREWKMPPSSKKPLRYIATATCCGADGESTSRYPDCDHWDKPISVLSFRHDRHSPTRVSNEKLGWRIPLCFSNFA